MFSPAAPLHVFPHPATSAWAALALAVLIASPLLAQRARPGPTLEDLHRIGNAPQAGVDRGGATIQDASEYGQDHTVSVDRLRNAPPPKAAQKVRRARQVAREGRNKKALKLLKKAIKIHPNYVEAHNNLAVRYIRLGRPELALEHLEIAARLAPSEALPYLNMAMALQMQGKLGAAMLNAERAVKLAPHLEEAHYNLGAILVARGRRLDEAVRRLGRVEADYPMATLIKVDALLQQGQPMKARNALRTFLAVRSAQPIR